MNLMKMLLGKHTQGVPVGQPMSELRILRGKTGNSSVSQACPVLVLKGSLLRNAKVGRE
jgi:hypothetical protein